jgi:uncharacterized protein
MALPDRRYLSRTEAQAAELDVGLRQHMLRVYNYMTSGLLLTGIVAYLIAQMAVVTDASGAIVGVTALGQALYGSPLMWVVMLSPLAFILVLSFGIQRMSFATLQLVFWAFAVAMGLSLSSIFINFTGTSIARVFFITAATFAAMSLYGYTTKRDLSKFGSFLFMGLIGVIIAMVVNIFLQSSALQFAVSVIGVLVFVGLTAWDTQRIKELYFEGDTRETAGKKAVMGAVSLYLDFVNIFMLLLHLLGDRR